ncbi:MAG: hypothetical protein R6X33_18120 [Candidatus Brocadiia bacterium]
MSTEVQPPAALARWLDGKRTYLTAAVILVCGILTAYGVEVPDYVWAALAALGLGFLRAGVRKAEIPE